MRGILGSSCHAVTLRPVMGLWGRGRIQRMRRVQHLASSTAILGSWPAALFVAHALLCCRAACCPPLVSLTITLPGLSTPLPPLVSPVHPLNPSGPEGRTVCPTALVPCLLSVPALLA